MPLSIIIVNYRSASLVIDCIESIHRFHKHLNAEIIVVDNNSEDGCKEKIMKKFPYVKWIPMNYNSGFARANNEGIRNAKGDVVLLLNPDTIFEDGSITHCYQRLIHSNYVGAGVQLKNPDGTPQITGSYFIKGGINHFLPLPVLGKLLKWLGTKLKVKKTSVLEEKSNLEVDWINGAFLMVKKSVIEKAGLLDEDFFLYSEEIEWCSRLRRYAKFCVYGDLHAIHLQGETANETFRSSGRGYFNLFDKKGKQIMLSGFVRIRKQFGARWFVVHLLIYLMEIPFLFLKVCWQYVFSSNKKGCVQFNGYCKNIFTVVKHSLLIMRNKPHFYKVL